MKKMLFVINPVSGKRALEDDLMKIIEIFSKNDYEVTIFLSKSKDDLVDKIISDSKFYDTIVCCGGDGTLNLVSGTIYKNNIYSLIGYIPGGTTNDFANTHHIETVVTEAAKQIVDGKINDVDLGLLNGEPFVYVAAFGMFSELSYLTTRELKQNMGYAAYISGFAKSILNSKSYKLNIETSSGNFSGEYIFGMVSNSKRIGGIDLPIIKNVEFDDGKMELTLIRKPNNPIDTQKIINCLLVQIADEDMVNIIHASKIKITSDTDIPWSLDGEYGGSYNISNLEVKNSAIKMIF